MRELKVGDHIKFVDEHLQAHDALVTCVWPGMGGECPPGCNLLFVCANEGQTDQYGRQIERRTSVAHKDGNGAPGWCWFWPDEEPPVFSPPIT